MEILSPPAFVLQAWTDLTVGFPSGATQPFTLRPGDTQTETPDHLVLKFIARPGGPAPEIITFYLHQVAWVSTIVRQVPVDPVTGKQASREAI